MAARIEPSQTGHRGRSRVVRWFDVQPCPPPRPWWRDRAVLLILAVALLVRLAVVVLYAHEPGGTPDPAFYWNAGANIAEGNGYRSPRAI